MIYSGLDICEINFHWQAYAVEKSLNLLPLLFFSFKYCSYFSRLNLVYLLLLFLSLRTHLKGLTARFDLIKRENNCINNLSQN